MGVRRSGEFRSDSHASRQTPCSGHYPVIDAVAAAAHAYRGTASIVTRERQSHDFQPLRSQDRAVPVPYFRKDAERFCTVPVLHARLQHLQPSEQLANLFGAEHELP